MELYYFTAFAKRDQVMRIGGNDITRTNDIVLQSKCALTSYHQIILFIAAGPPSPAPRRHLQAARSQFVENPCIFDLASISVQKRLHHSPFRL